MITDGHAQETLPPVTVAPPAARQRPRPAQADRQAQAAARAAARRRAADLAARRAARRAAAAARDARPAPASSGGGGTPTGYAAPVSSAGTKTNTPLVETPRSVSVVTRRELDDRGVQTIPEAVRYTAGVTTGASGFDPRFDQISVRGFPLTTLGDYRDGLRQGTGGYATFRTEPYGLERIDIIKGPASVLYGQGSPGGLVDRISKLPTIEPFREVRVQVSPYGLTEGAFDLSGPASADKTLLYRLVGVGRGGDTAYDIRDDRLYLAPSFTWRPTEDTTLTVLGHVQKDETDGNVGFINRNGRALTIRASDAAYDRQKQEQWQLGYHFEHRFSEMFAVRQNLRAGGVDLTSRYLTGGLTGGSFANNSSTFYRRGATAIVDNYGVFTVDNQAETNVSTGPVAHKILTGLDYQSLSDRFGLGNLAPQPYLGIDVANPLPGRIGPTPAITSRMLTSTDQIGLYVQDQMSFDRWRLNLGLRQDYASRTATNVVTNSVTAKRDDERLTYNAGLLYLFDNGFAPYASYATSFQPVTFLGRGGVGLPPQYGEQMEAGLKYAPTGAGFSATVSAFDLTESNTPKLAGTDPATGLLFYESVGKIRNRGIETEVKGTLGDGFDLTAAYTYVDSKIKASRTFTELGKTPAVTPVHVLAVWLNHRFESGPLRGLGTGVGVRWTSETFIDNVHTGKNPQAGFLDAAIRYDLAALDARLAGFTTQVSGTNLLDYRDVVCNAGLCYRGQPRVVRGTLTYRW